MQTTSFTLAGPLGADAVAVSIRCAIDTSKPTAFCVEGATAVQTKEIAVRVRSAFLAADVPWPAGQVTIAVDAGGAKLFAAALDLPIALAIAGVDTSGLLVAGELGLDGSVRRVRGVLAAALLAKGLGLRGVLVPSQNAAEALAADAGVVHEIDGLRNVALALATKAVPARRALSPRAVPDFSEVRGQADVIALVEKAVKTRSGLLLSGSPGVGKTMIARRIPGLLPALKRDEQIAVTRVYSALGLADGLVAERPFRAPHHTISAAALAGGGSSPRPGEAQLAAHGILFLDEIVEFARGTIEALAFALDRMPVSARPLIVVSANPCSCGYQSSALRKCTCTEEGLARYNARLEWAIGKLGVSIRVLIQPTSAADLRSLPTGEPTASIAKRIADVPNGAAQ
jgi:magnesium chelatase family protein